MPGGDGTGPLGAGPMTGRGMGNCAGAAGLGFGRGRGFSGGGRGWRHWFKATGVPGWMRFGRGGAPFVAAPGADAEKQMLSEQARALQDQLDTIKMRLNSMGVDKPAK
jgi:hypothetical protein